MDKVYFKAFWKLFNDVYLYVGTCISSVGNSNKVNNVAV